MKINKIELPQNIQRRKELYCIMLDLSSNCKLTNEELERICLERGYLIEDSALNSQGNETANPTALKLTSNKRSGSSSDIKDEKSELIKKELDEDYEADRKRRQEFAGIYSEGKNEVMK